jgi:DNA-binding LacI/PurR family transcriptional regulator
MPRIHPAAGQSAPPYRVITEDLRRQILAGRWTMGAQLPSRRDLAEQYEVTPNTINRAIAALMDEGFVGANDRQGTFIARVTVGGARAANAPAPGPTGRGPWRVGVVVALDDGSALPDQPADLWTATVLDQFERAISVGGAVSSIYNVYWGRDAAPDPTVAIRRIQADRLDAVAVLDVHNRSGWDDAAAAIDWRALPAVYVAGVGMRVPFPQLCHDQRHAGYLAARHLVDAGYTRLIFLRPCGASWIDDRVDGLRLGARHAGLPEQAFSVHPPTPPMSYAAFNERAERTQILTRLFDEVAGRWDGSTAIVCHADQQALEVIRRLGELSRVPGRDLGVLGFDDAPGDRAAGLTSVRPPLEQLGERAAQLVLSGLAKGAEAAQVCLPPVVIQRDSTRRS